MFLGKEILIHILLEKSLTDFEILMNYLHIKIDQSRIACLRLDGLILSVFIAMQAERLTVFCIFLLCVK